jgi:2-oxoglutarate dehydrogenase E2 component (dihydrolipoamide succinyltransferase)
MGDSITEGTIVDLPVAPGDYVQTDDVVVVLETDKVSVDVRAPEGGALVEVLGEIDDVVEVGSGLFRIDTDADAPERAAAPMPDKEETLTPMSEIPAPAPAAPSPAPATAAPAPSAAAPAPAPPKASPPPKAEAPVFMGQRTERRTKMSRMRQRVAARLKEAQNTAAMLTTFQECDMGNLMEMRKKYQDVFVAKHGIKLGFMSAFVLAATAALQEIPAVNAYIDDETKEVVYRDYCDISVAVASPTGLVVPVLRNTELMSFADVEHNIAAYAEKAKNGTLALDDMAGGTFTISNGGVFGSLMGTPIINPPQSAILGMHATKMRAVVNDKGEVVARPMMYLALTYDHRLIDGREGVTFLKSIAEKISDPSKLLLEV